MMPTDSPTADRTKRIRLDLTEAEQQRLRIVAAQAGLSMSAYVRDLVLSTIETAEANKKTSKKA